MRVEEKGRPAGLVFGATASGSVFAFVGGQQVGYLTRDEKGRAVVMDGPMITPPNGVERLIFSRRVDLVPRKRKP